MIDVHAPQELTRHRRPPLRRAGYPGASPWPTSRASWASRSRRSTTTSTLEEDLLWEIAQEEAAAFHAALDGRPCGAPRRRSESASRSAAHLAGRRGSSSTSRPSSCASGATWKASGRHGFLAERRRYEDRDPRPVPRGRRARRPAHRSRPRNRRPALPLGCQLGLHVAATGDAGTDELADRLAEGTACRHAWLRLAVADAGSSRRSATPPAEPAAVGLLLDQRHHVGACGDRQRDRTVERPL